MPFPGIVRRIQPKELYDFRKIVSVCFGGSFTETRTPEEYGEDELRNAATSRDKIDACALDKYVAEYEGRVVAALCALPHEIVIDGGLSRMCGIGGVCTLPGYRRLGAVRAMLTASLQEEADKGTEWSLLYPFSQSYYEKFGYALSEPDVQWSLSLHHVRPCADKSFTFTLYEDRENEIAGYQEAYARLNGYNLMAHREYCDYTKVTTADPYKRNNLAFLCRDKEGTARGYIVWYKKRENNQAVMEVTELVFDSFAALHALIGFASGFASDYDVICFKTPADVNAEPLCTDYISGHLTRTIVPNGMVRAVHVENALRGARLKGSGEAALWIDDPTLNKQYHLGLRWQDERLTDFGPTTLTPDARLPIGAFSALLLGRYDERDYSYLPEAEFIRPDKLTGLFYKKPIHTKNFF